MNVVVVHDMKGASILLNVDNLNTAIRKVPDENAVINEPFTKLYFVQRDMTMGAMGFPDVVKETPEEIYDLIAKGGKAKAKPKK